jgi:glycosyltransferase involved in cell wall biosynthesis
MPLVSIIMPMRNSAATVEATVRSIQRQTLEVWELIVIDDGSTDRSADIVQGIGDARIRLVRESVGRGLAARLNQAIALCTGEYIARMDSDDLCFPERLARQVERLRSDPSIDVLGCGAVVFDAKGAPVGLLPCATLHADIVRRPYVGFPLPHPSWCGQAPWFRKHLYNALLTKAEDHDLMLRSFRTSRFAALDGVLLGYRQPQLDLTKLLPGRRASMGAIWRDGARSGEMPAAAWGIAMQCAKGAVDIATIRLGLNRVMQRQRLAPVPDAVMRQWAALRPLYFPVERDDRARANGA